MRALIASCLVSLAFAGSALAQQPSGGSSTPAPIVFFDLAGPDASALGKFYDAVFGWKTGPGGSLSVQVSGPSAGLLLGTMRQDPAEKVIYIGVPDVTKALADVVAHGGKVHAPRFEVKGVVVLGLFMDPAGNRMGLVEMGADGKAKVP